VEEGLVNYELIVVGASWGGLHAVGEILAALPADTEAAVVVAQHRQADTVEGGLAGLLQLRATLPVKDVDDKAPIERGQVYLAPPDYHLLIQRGYFSLSKDDHIHHARPSIDVLFESAADAYGERVVGVILTGANADGAHGLAEVKRRGGVAVVQDPGTAERREMPAAALARTAADAVLPLAEIGPFLYGLVCPPTASRVEP
jgi:two-component system, chemotaxis family, protein-glutamate methylesterase/glutaminase